MTERLRGDTTPFCYPPLRDQGLPERVPWDTHILLLTGLWIERFCVPCEHGGPYPIRLLAAQQGWFLTIRGLVPRLKCAKCGRPFGRLVLQDGSRNGSPGSLPRALDLNARPAPAWTSPEP